MTAAYLAIRAADVLPDEPRLWFLDHAGAAEAACAIELPLTLVPALSTTRWAVVARVRPAEKLAPTKSMEIRGHADNDGARRLRLWLAERNLTPETMAVQIGLDDPRPLVLAARGAAAPTTVLLYALRSVCGIETGAWSTPC